LAQDFKVAIGQFTNSPLSPSRGQLLSSNAYIISLYIYSSVEFDCTETARDVKIGAVKQNFNIILAFHGRQEHQKPTLYRFPSASNNCPSQFELTLRSPWHQLRILFAVLGRSLFHIASERAVKRPNVPIMRLCMHTLFSQCARRRAKNWCVYNTMHRSHTMAKLITKGQYIIASEPFVEHGALHF
jgi:hypothetical protein